MSLTSEILQELTDKAGMDFTGGVYLSNADADAVIQEYVDRGIIQKIDSDAGSLLISFIEYVINYNDEEYHIPLPIMPIKDGNDYVIKVRDTINQLSNIYKTADTLLALIPAPLVGVLIGADLGITLNDLAYEWYDEDQQFWYWDKEKYKEISWDDLVTLYYNVTTNSWYVPKEVYNEVIDSMWARGVVQLNAEQPMATGVKHYTNSWSGLSIIDGSIEPRQLVHYTTSDNTTSWTKTARGIVAFRRGNRMVFGAPSKAGLYLAFSQTTNNDNVFTYWQGTSDLPRGWYDGSVHFSVIYKVENGYTSWASSGSLVLTSRSTGTTYTFSLGDSWSFSSIEVSETVHDNRSIWMTSSDKNTLDTNCFYFSDIMQMAMSISGGGHTTPSAVTSLHPVLNLTSMEFAQKIHYFRDPSRYPGITGSCNVSSAENSESGPAGAEIVWDWFHSIPDSSEESEVESDGIVPSEDTPDYPPYSDDDIVPIPAPPINPYRPEPTTETTDIPDDPTVPIPTITNKWRDIDPTPPPEPGGDPMIVTPGSGSVPVPSADEPNDEIGFCAIWRMTPAYLESFCQWLWSTNFIDQVLAYFTSPNDAIIGVHKIYWTPTYDTVMKKIQCGYLNSNCLGWPVTKRYNTIDCGTVTLDEEYENVYDYTDTEIIIYLPYVGFVPLDISLCMRGSIGVKYVLDVVSGAGVCQISVTRDGLENHIASYGCSCGSTIPISSGNYVSLLQSVATAAAQPITGIAGLANSKAFSKLNDFGKAAEGLKVAESAFGALEGAKTNVQLSGRFSSQVGDMDNKKPYLIIKRPKAVPAQHNYEFIGKPSRQTAVLSTLHGFNQVIRIHPTTSGDITSEEMSELEELFAAGVMM